MTLYTFASLNLILRFYPSFLFLLNYEAAQTTSAFPTCVMWRQTSNLSTLVSGCFPQSISVERRLLKSFEMFL
jgi:hypothetical protein